ncbi:hypothetical protein GYB22_08255 [bacterium]|nr:hypothetical protein [bacterium]
MDNKLKPDYTYEFQPDVTSDGYFESLFLKYYCYTSPDKSFERIRNVWYGDIAGEILNGIPKHPDWHGDKSTDEDIVKISKSVMADLLKLIKYPEDDTIMSNIPHFKSQFDANTIHFIIDFGRGRGLQKFFIPDKRNYNRLKELYDSLTIPGSELIVPTNSTDFSSCFTNKDPIDTTLGEMINSRSSYKPITWKNKNTLKYFLHKLDPYVEHTGIGIYENAIGLVEIQFEQYNVKELKGSGHVLKSRKKIDHIDQGFRSFV